ncbi:class I SAM-dependent DNA methyltransferase [Rubrivirga litoralis]|uniref:Class I SAM-dependent methyltransferase n=1 Tax=Rubrivirga litoralis TaxID=3075598 RepID=A0ABU3BNP6_9BACT|nr:class I SAM-dependent methyltransferase [Rubrivirga sp. F394]MDT0630888.1 class I SAM-dependent methyltransferase [Rubrivirga sp. F394]
MTAPPYSDLAAGYDAVMAHVDYPMWAGYVRGLLRRHAPEAQSVTELGCGTGALARALQPMGPAPDGFDYRAFDGSADMVDVAQAATERADRNPAGRPVTFGVADFREPVPAPPADAVVLVYDGLNYLLDEADVAALLGHIAGALVPGGVAVVDQSTPANSLAHPDGFDDAGETDAFRYLRTSRYDAEAGLHTTTFTLTRPNGSRTTETHVQRAYSVEAVRALVAASPLDEVAAYDGFSTDPATAETERVHWVLRRPAQARPA